MIYTSTAREPVHSININISFNIPQIHNKNNKYDTEHVKSNTLCKITKII